jgi:lysozyme
VSIIFNRKINSDGLELIKKWEGLHDGDLTMIGLQPKLCPAGVWTEGYGRAMRGKDGKFLRGSNCSFSEAIRQSSIRTLEEAEEALIEDTGIFSGYVNGYLGNIAVNGNQFSACVSLCYNIGNGAFGRSEVLRRLKTNQFDLAAIAFRNWRMGGGKVLSGLVKRREDEIKLFNKKVD